MSLDDKQLRRGYRNAWLLAALSVLFVAAFAYFTIAINTPEPEVKWDMGGKPFVPASGPEASGYFAPVKAPPVEARP